MKAVAGGGAHDWMQLRRVSDRARPERGRPGSTVQDRPVCGCLADCRALRARLKDYEVSDLVEVTEYAREAMKGLGCDE